MDNFLGQIKHFSVEPAVRNLYRNEEQKRLREQTAYNRSRDKLGDFRFDQRLKQQNEDRAYQRGRQVKADRRSDQMYSLKLGQMRERKAERAENKQHDHLARVAYLADTPEKWARMTGALKNKGYNFGDQYNDFASRESVLAEYGDLSMIKSLFKPQIDPLTQSKIELNRAKIQKTIGENKNGFDSLSATDKKALYSAEDELPSLEGAIKDLERARELLPKTNTAFAPELRATLGNATGFDKEASAATTEYAQLMGLQTFQIMSKLLKGAMSDREMAQFQKIIGDTSAPHSVRKNALDRMVNMARNHLNVKKRRIGELRGSSQQSNTRDNLIQQARDAISRGADKNLVMQRLQEKLGK